MGSNNESENNFNQPIFDGPNPKEQEDALKRLSEGSTIIFRRLPTTIYPDMPYVTPDDLADSGLTNYSSSHITRLARSGDIESARIDRKILITPLAIEQLLIRQVSSEAGELDKTRNRKGGGRRPGPKVTWKSRRKNPWPIENFDK